MDSNDGVQSLYGFLKEHNLYDGNHAALTESEARLLIGVPGLDAARDRIAAAIREERLRNRAEGVPRLTPHKSKVANPDSVSKVFDENGEPLVVYHGTPTGGFNHFMDYPFFTDNPGLAEIYTSASASSRRFGKKKTKGKVYLVFLKMKRPFDTRTNEKAREIFDEFADPSRNNTEHYSYAQKLSGRSLPGWLEFDSLVGFMEERGYLKDFDGFILDEGVIGGLGEQALDRGISYVPLSPTQINSATGNVGTFSDEMGDIN